MTIQRTSIAVTGATGGAGVATANETSTVTVNGTSRGVHLTYVGSPPAGTTCCFSRVVSETRRTPPSWV